MKTIPAGVRTILDGRRFYMADLFTFTLFDGSVHRYCSGDYDIVYGGNTYSAGIAAGGPFFYREGDNSTIKWTTGLQNSTLEFTVNPGNGTINGVAWATAVSIGMFDYADFQLDRAVMTSPGVVTAGIIGPLFVGTVGEIEGGRGSGERFIINSYNDLLNIEMPRNLYQAPCINSLYDSACTLVKASFGVAGTVAAGSTASSINASLSAATGYFDLGSVTFTSGANNGAVRTVKAYTNGSPSVFTIIPPLPNVPSVADSFTIYPGCDKTQQTCLNKFSNLANFRGFPGIPTPETAV